ncbi:fimbrial protein [[Pantoea] beijingensis]|uniref:Fimbrial protein n=1 Tax=[Pantoea] beijingensis TaxID=1324864 RepID=A0A443IDX6_9GAMM|nr:MULTISPECIES: fimbria/pilus outer membrane usher protein [Erwiniaceae]RWR02354.1 fimbrial protein [[Pantoea] beijingensis]
MYYLKLKGFKLSPVSGSIILVMGGFVSCNSLADVSFNPDFLNSTVGQSVDISRFNGEYRVPPGDYTPDIYLNGRLIDRAPVSMRGDSGKSHLCFNESLLTRLNLNTARLSKESLASLNSENACSELESLVPGAHARLSLSDMRLNLSIPQAYLNQTAHGYVPPAMWSYGEKALYLSYNTTYFEQYNKSNIYKSFYGDVKGSLNLGAWMLKHSGAYRWDDRYGGQYNDFSTALQRDIPTWNSRILFGDANTSGELFDSFSFRGVQLATADQMLPDSLRGYAPVVRGIARTNAKVSIKQRDRVIYETSVPPGEFAIQDLYPTGYGGDLQVTVTEADGSQNIFSVPFSSVAELLRPGRITYNLVMGRLRNVSVSEEPYVFQGTWKQGVNNIITSYTGVTATDYYYSGIVGSAFGTPVGAFAFDITGARFNKDGRSQNGVSLRASYSKYITATRSSFSLAAYRFSSSGYLDLHNAVYVADNIKHHDFNAGYDTISRPRNRVSLTLSQDLGNDFGQLYISGYRENYWNDVGSNTQYQAGYNNSYKWLGYGLAVNRTETRNREKETQYLLNFSVPLGSGRNTPNLNSYTTIEKRGVTSQLGVGGTLGEQGQLSYNVSAGRDASDNYSGNVSGAYKFRDATLNGSFSKGKSYHSYSAGLSGSVVAFSDGIVTSPYDGLDTMAIVSAKDAAGASVEGYSGVKLNRWGYALVPYLTPYRINNVAINPKGLPFDVELDASSKQIAPAQGAIVKLDYATRKGRMVLIRATMPEGDALPFGAAVTDSHGENVGVVAQGGQIYARLNLGKDRLNIHWGGKQQFTCAFDINLRETPSDQGIERVNTVCDGDDPGMRQNLAFAQGTFSKNS